MSAREQAREVGRKIVRTAKSAAKATGAGVRAVAGGTLGTVKRGLRSVKTLLLNLWVYWYVARKRHVPQELFLFGPHGPYGSKKFQGLLGGRGLGKTFALMRKALLLAFLNRGTAENPIWGAIFGRTLKEVQDKLLPVLREACAELERDFGIPIMPEYDEARGVLIFPFGSAVYLLSYEKRESLQLARGYNLGWVVIDEVEVAPISTEELLAVLNFAIRDPRAKHKTLAWASTPRGLKGLPKMHREAFERGDPNFFLAHGTIYDNKYLSREDIETIKATIPSKRLWSQEGLGLCIAPTNTVLPEYDEKIHLTKYRWKVKHKTVIIIDWGTRKGYIGACKVDERGTWVVAKERRPVHLSRRKFRREVDDFIAEIRDLDEGNAPYAIVCDRAVVKERYWLANRYGKEVGGRVLWLTEATEMLVEWGCAIISSFLDPDDGPPKLYLSDELTSSIETDTLGMRGAMKRYTFAQIRDKWTGEILTLDEPDKLNGGDDPIDALRYGIVSTRGMPELHGGKPLPFVDDDTKIPTAPKGRDAMARVVSLWWPASNDNDLCWGVAA